MTTVDKDVEELKRSCTSGYVKLENLWHFLKKLNIITIHVSSSTPRYIPKRLKNI